MKMQNGGPPEMQNGGTKIAYVNGTLHVDISQYDSDNESQWSSASSYSKVRKICEWSIINKYKKMEKSVPASIFTTMDQFRNVETETC